MDFTGFAMPHLKAMMEALGQFVENSEEGDTAEETYKLNPDLRAAEELLDAVTLQFHTVVGVSPATEAETAAIQAVCDAPREPVQRKARRVRRR